MISKSDIQKLNESYNSIAIKDWRKGIQNDIITLAKLDAEGGKVTGDSRKSLRIQSNSLSEKIEQKIKDVNGYQKLYRFHELEYKLHLLQTKYNDVNLIDFTKHELITLFNWLKEYMLGILDTRVFFNYYNTPEKYTEFLNTAYQQYTADSFNEEPDPEERKIGGVPWESIHKSYYMLNHANTVSEKIKAITLSLNAWHDNGGIFGVGSHHEDDPAVWMFAPLSIQQYDSLGNINANKVEMEIKKDLQ